MSRTEPASEQPLRWEPLRPHSSHLAAATSSAVCRRVRRET